MNIRLTIRPLLMGVLMIGAAPMAKPLPSRAAVRVVAAGDPVVRTATAVLRQSANAFSRPVATLRQNETVTILRTQGSWLYVRTARGTGYLAQSSVAVASRIGRVAAVAGRGQATGGSDAAAATRGLAGNAAVEDTLKQAQPELRYDQVDRIEASPASGSADPYTAFKPFRQTGKLGEFKPTTLAPTPTAQPK